MANGKTKNRATATPAAALHHTKNNLAEEVRKASIDLLQGNLVDIIDLSTQTRQAHWNVKGPHFIGLHQLFDDIYEDLDGHIDTIAERIVILGGTAHGQARKVAESSRLSAYPETIYSGADHVEALSSALAAYSRTVRTSIDAADDAGDADTADLFTGVSRAIEKWLWFVEAHQQASE